MNLTNVFIDILRSAMTQTSCNVIKLRKTEIKDKF